MKFRSRLEARVAVFLDALDIKYLYEPEGYSLSDGTLYLPDFYLPVSKQFIEVKGIMNAEDEHKIEQALEDGLDVVTIYSDFSFECAELGSRPIIDGVEDNNWFEDYYYKSSTQNSVLAHCLCCDSYYFLGMSEGWECRCCGAYDGDGHFTTELNGDGYNKCYSDTPAYKALQIAMQSRFEHGQTPTSERIHYQMRRYL